MASKAAAREGGTNADQLLDALDRPDFRKLQQAIARFRALGKTRSSHPLARPSDCALILDRFEQILQEHRRRFETEDAQTLEGFFGLLRVFAASDVAAYGAQSLRLVLIECRACLLIRRAQQALDAISPFAEQPYRIEGGFFQFLDVFELDLEARLALGRIDEIACVALGRAQFLARAEPKHAYHVFRRMAPFVALRGKPALPDAAPDWRDGGVIALARQSVSLMGRRRVLGAKALRRPALAGVAVIGALALALSSWRRPLGQLQLAATKRAPPRALLGRAPKPTLPILVTRPMGGLGDLAMMLPGLRQLALKTGRKIAFAIPKTFHAAFADIPYIELLATDRFIDLSHYRKWVHLGLCPAARHEARKTPRIKLGRVVLFAKAMGIRGARLRGMAQCPQIARSEGRLALVRQLRQSWSGAGRKIIGIGLFSRETYRDFPHLDALIVRLAHSHEVIAIHHAPIELPANGHIHGFFSRPLDEALAAIEACDLFISVDSAFLHFAGAFGVPTLAVFGPTSGAVRTQHIPAVRVIEAQGFACRPCWRNEDEACILTKTSNSACMQAVTVDHILANVQQMLGGRGGMAN